MQRVFANDLQKEKVLCALSVRSSFDLYFQVSYLSLLEISNPFIIPHHCFYFDLSLGEKIPQRVRDINDGSEYSRYDPDYKGAWINSRTSWLQFGHYDSQ